MRAPRILAVATAAFALALAGGLTPAQASSAVPSEWSGLSFHIGSEVRLMAGGAAAAVPISYVCSNTRLFGANFGYAFVSVQVSQNFGDGQSADGSDLGGEENTDLICDARPHGMRVLVFAGIPVGTFAYRVGAPAQVAVGVQACDVDETACIQPTKHKWLPTRPARTHDPLSQPVDLTARLGTDGMVTVLVPPGCPPGGYEWVNIELSQRVPGEHVTLGDAFSNPSDCRRHLTPVSFQTFPFPARHGRAYVLINWTSCDATTTRCTGGRIEGILGLT